MRLIKCCILSLLFSSFFGVPSLYAVWLADGNSVCSYSNSQDNPRIISDGSGGAIIVWEDYRSGTYRDIYVQRIDALGNVQWTTDGTAVCTAGLDQRGPRITSDGSGGVLIAWVDERNGLGFTTIYAQHIDAAGNAVWAADGVAVCSSILSADYVDIVSDDAGGAIITWQDYRSSTDFDIYAQRIDASGVLQWTTNGVAVCTAANDQQSPRITTDGSGGAIITWEDYRGGSTFAVYVQRVDASGAVGWTADGVSVCSAVWNSTRPEIVSDGSGGAFIVWNSDYAGDFDIYAQRVDSTGALQWIVCGIAVCTASGSQTWHKLIRDGAGGLIVTWNDWRSGNIDVYAQKLNSVGTTLWAANGIGICTQVDMQIAPSIASDGVGGAIITWPDLRSTSSGLDIYAQRVDPSGTALWTADGEVICSAASSQGNVAIVGDGSQGAVVAWVDARTGTNDIYAQYVDSLGRAGYEPPVITAVRDVPDDQGGKIILQWQKSKLDALPQADVTYYSAWRRLPLYAASSPAESSAEAGQRNAQPGGGEAYELLSVNVPLDLEGKAHRTAGGYSWEWLANVPAHFFDSYSLLVTSLSDSMGSSSNRQYFMVTAHTNYPSLYYDSAVDSGYSVDNLSPPSPSPVAGDQKISPPGLDIHWPASSAADLSHYAVYRGTDEFFIPGDGNRIAAPADTSYFDASWTWDGGYYYKVSAIDVHGNESGFSLLRPDGVTGADGEGVPANRFFLAQNVPNPFNLSTLIRFGLSEAGPVTLKIYDASGRLVRAVANGWKEAGEHTELWNGRDASGKPLASGVYFVMIKSGDFKAVRKMVLMR